MIPETNETNNISALELQIKMTAHRVTRQQADIASYNGIDDPIQPKTDLKILAQAPPLGLGVVADGVTPVLFKIIAPPGNYSLSVLSGQPYGELLTSRLFVLGSSGGWLKQTSIRIPQPPNGAKSGTNFAYLAGIDWADYRITLDEITVNVSLLSSVTGSHVSEIEFTNRPPPIVLVHGYNADASSWGPNFLAALESVRPKDFIVPISYGVSLETDPITGEITTNKTPNTTGRLDELAPILGEKLASTVENPNNDLRNEWAFTRYDIVCHSQGGVLTRMLCSQVPRYRTQPFVDEANMYRGRFRRIITIGSPHNGSLLLHYLLQLKRSSSLFYSSLPRILGDILQDKFDPFLDQMLDINNPFYSIDERAKFRLIRCVIDGGDSPGILSPPVFHLIGLSDQLVIADPLPVLTSRGALVIPRGSDGVVDFDSQGAGISGPGPIISEIDSDNVVHADAYPLLFGVLPRHSETTYRPVANEVVSLLNGPTNAFGKFKLPPPVPGSIRLAIDSIVPTLEPINIIKLIPGAKDLSYHFQVTPDPSRPAQGQVTWFAEAFTTNGVSTDGITLTTNTNNPTAVTVTVADSVVGDVVLYASYSSTNNILVVALPVVVVSRPAGMVMTGITLVPGSATMSIGDTLRPDIWATYTNGLRSQLYIPIGQASYTSSNTNVAVVDAAGTITLNSFGSATITASYNGFTATIPISSVTPEVRNLAGTMTTNGLFGLSYMGTYMMTNVIQASTNLSDWISLATLQNTNGFVQYTDTESPSLQQRFYRVLIK